MYGTNPEVAGTGTVLACLLGCLIDKLIDRLQYGGCSAFPGLHCAGTVITQVKKTRQDADKD